MRASQSQDGGGSLSTSSRYTLASLRRHQSFDETYLKDAERVEPSTSWFLNVRHEQSMDNFVLNPRKLIFFLHNRERPPQACTLDWTKEKKWLLLACR